MLSALLTLLVVGIVGAVAVAVVMAVLGMVVSITFGIAGFLLFKVAPLLLIGWLVLKVVDRTRARRQIAPADQKWLDG